MQEPVDFIALVVAILAMLTSHQVAGLIGPYAAIAVLAIAGAGISFSLNEGEFSIWQAMYYVSIRVLLAVVITVSMAELLVQFVDWAKPRYTIAPLALVIGLITDFKKAWGFIKENFATLWSLKNGKSNTP